MSAEPAPRVRQVGTIEEHRISFDSSTGEMCPNCEVFHRDIESLEADLKLKRRRIAELESDKTRHAEHHELWEPARELYAHYQAVCNKRRSPWTSDRFYLVLPFLKRKEHGPDRVRQAIDGAAYQSWCSELTNGRFEIHNKWDKIFESSDSLERYVNRVPRGWNLAYSIEMESWPARKPTEGGVWFGIRPPQGWQPPAAETSTGQVTLVGVADD